MAPKITAGHVDDINQDSGQWLIVDIGFSETENSCGVWNDVWGVKEPKAVTFAALVELAKKEIQKDVKEPLNLLIEAPLSVAFTKDGNPTLRICDSQDGKKRRWYVNAGGTTLIAASWFLRELKECQGQREVRLFEGFLSFKSRNTVPKNKHAREEAHKEDVGELKKAVWTRKNAKIFDREDIGVEGCYLRSAFHFLDKDLIPPVIRINP